jgi:signal peptidase II
MSGLTRPTGNCAADALVSWNIILPPSNDAASMSATAGSRGRSLAIGLGIAAAIIVADQISKWWILDVVMSPPRVIEITGFFNLVLTWNRGISFGILNADLPGTRWLLSGLAMCIVGGLVWWLARTSRPLAVAAIGLIAGGAIGNVIDRLRFGAVVDFLDFHVAGWHWPAFNVADSAITTGVVLLILDSLFVRPEER